MTRAIALLALLSLTAAAGFAAGVWVSWPPGPKPVESYNSRWHCRELPANNK